MHAAMASGAKRLRRHLSCSRRRGARPAMWKPNSVPKTRRDVLTVQLPVRTLRCRHNAHGRKQFRVAERRLHAARIVAALRIDDRGASRSPRSPPRQALAVRLVARPCSRHESRPRSCAVSRPRSCVGARRASYGHTHAERKTHKNTPARGSDRTPHSRSVAMAPCTTVDAPMWTLTLPSKRQQIGRGDVSSCGSTPRNVSAPAQAPAPALLDTTRPSVGA